MRASTAGSIGASGPTAWDGREAMVMWTTLDKARRTHRRRRPTQSMVQMAAEQAMRVHPRNWLCQAAGRAPWGVLDGYTQ
ncbi:hypothetical protein GCM10007320_42310 [Pseudorhodoferax aquiterrae]|uniref:Uncharacterized protein n=1 Tax=Pseudorhodoferax aquiterrae TaxID=747304 RepID=A0ABQ3G6Y1_9BURK|nr:hypothetical protein GCM10007320_42310 [Pseudorhodoferax aquiterrae]